MKYSVLSLIICVLFISCASTNKTVSTENPTVSAEDAVVKAPRINPKKLQLPTIEWSEEVFDCTLENGTVSVPFLLGGKTYSFKVDPSKGKYLIVQPSLANAQFKWNRFEIQEDGTLDSNVQIPVDADSVAIAYTNDTSRYDQVYKRMLVKKADDLQPLVIESDSIPRIAISYQCFKNKEKLVSGQYYYVNIPSKEEYVLVKSSDGKNDKWFTYRNTEQKNINFLYKVPDNSKIVHFYTSDDGNHFSSDLVEFSVEKGKFKQIDMGTPVSKKEGNVTIIVEPFRELYNLVYYLCSIDEEFFMNKDSSEYLIEAQEYFWDYKEHPLLKFVKSNPGLFTQNNRFYIDRSMLKFWPNSDANIDDIYLPFENSYFDSYQFYLDLLDFAEDTNYASFFNSHIDYYIDYRMPEGFNCVQKLAPWLASFFRNKEKFEQTIYLHKGEWADVSYEKNKGIYSFRINLSSGINSDPTGLAHEIAHPFTSELVKKLYNSDLKWRFDAKWQENSNTDAGINYPSGYDFLNDSMARACAGCSIKQLKPESYRGYLNSQARIGFVLVPELTEVLDNYVTGNYKNIDAFYDELYEFFNQIL